MSTDQITGNPSNIVLYGTDTYSDPVTIASDATVTGQPAVLAQDVRGIENDGTVTGTNTGIEFKAGGSLTNVAGGTITGYKYGVVGDKNGVPTDVVNQGYIGATTPQEFYSPQAWGIRLQSGGSVTNGSTGTITGYDGISIKGAYGSIDNAGHITGYDTGISLGSQGGRITNEATGTITGTRNYGIYIKGQGTVDNSGLIQVDGYSPWAAVRLSGAGTVINQVHGTISGDAGGSYGGAGVKMVNYYSDPGTPSMVDNFGTISGFWGVYFGYGANGTLTNESTGSIFGAKYGVQMSDIGTVVNSGTITAGYYSGVRLRDDGTVINKAGGTIVGGTDTAPGGVSDNASGVYIGGDNATLENAGTIIATLGDAVDLSAGDTNRLIVDAGAVFQGNVVANASAANTLELSSTYGAGTISGIGTQFKNFQTVTIDSGAQWDIGAISTSTTVLNAGTVGANSTIGIELDAGGAVTNAHGGVIEGVTDGILIKTAAGAIDNSGTLLGTGDHGYGIYLGAGGTITNEATGTISGVYTGVGLGAGGTIVNSGTIVGTGGLGVGVVLVDDGSIDNTGSIGGNAYGVYLTNGGTIFNEAGGKITGGGDGIDVKGGGSATIENAGTIKGEGAYSVELNAITNRLIVDAGASFVGDVKATGVSNTLELKAGATPGTIYGLGSKYQGFTAVSIDAGGTWTVAGTIAGFATPVIQGFDTSDRLDLTNLGYTSDNSFSLSNTDLLTISENGTAVATIQLSGDFTGDFFRLTDDGKGGSYVTEDENPVCYCRGTMIRTDRGEIAVQGLRIGDRVITASGQAKPIRWIGRRSYSGKFAGNNPNILPVCFKAGSLARNVPRRDLWVSPEHAMFIDGVLIPARCLVNGDSVFQANRTDGVEYFHIELDRHDVIVAEGALSESYADDDNRGRFQNAHEFRTLYPEHIKQRGALYCAPRLEDGVAVEKVQVAIAARALRLKWRTNRADTEAAA